MNPQISLQLIFLSYACLVCLFIIAIAPSYIASPLGPDPEPLQTVIQLREPKTYFYPALGLLEAIKG